MRRPLLTIGMVLFIASAIGVGWVAARGVAAPNASPEPGASGTPTA